MLSSQRNMKNVLRLNAGFSAVSGLLLIFYQPLVDKMGILNYQIAMLIGLGLLTFAGLVFYTSRQLHLILVKTIIIQDLLWVLVSIIVLVIHPWNLSQLGYGLIGAVAVVIAAILLLQIKYLKEYYS